MKMILDILNNIQTAENLADVATAIGVVLAVLTFIYNAISSRNDARNKKKRETIDFYRSIGDKCNEALRIIDNKINDTLKKQKIKCKNSYVIGFDNAKESQITINAVMGYLCLMDEFSVGLNNGVFDIKIFGKSSAGIEAVICYELFEDIISKIRQKDKRLYNQFELVVDKIKKKQNKQWEQYKQEMQEKIDLFKTLFTKKQELAFNDNEGNNNEPIEFNYEPDEIAVLEKLGKENRNYIFPNT